MPYKVSNLAIAPGEEATLETASMHLKLLLNIGYWSEITIAKTTRITTVTTVTRFRSRQPSRSHLEVEQQAIPRELLKSAVIGKGWKRVCTERKYLCIPTEVHSDGEPNFEAESVSAQTCSVKGS